MPRVNSSKPPRAMVWRGAVPVLVAALLFDVIRAFFTMFWFFGPALATMYCTTKANDFLATWTYGALGTKTVLALCTTGATALGISFSELTIPFGTVMALATGLVAFLALGLWLVVGNPRIFKANKTGVLRFVGGFGLSEIPFVNVFPVFFIVLWSMYRKQIHVEGKKLKAWNAKHASEQHNQRRLKVAQMAQIQSAQLQEQEMQDEEAYEQESANDDVEDYEQEFDKAA